MSDPNDSGNGNSAENGMNIVTSSCYFGASEDFSVVLTDENGKKHNFRITSPGDSKSLKEMLLKKSEQLKKKEEGLEKATVELESKRVKILEIRSMYSNFNKEGLEEEKKRLEEEKKEKSKNAKGNKTIQEELKNLKNKISDLGDAITGIEPYEKKAQRLNEEIKKLKSIKIELNLKGSNRISEYEYGLQAARWERIAELTEGKINTSSVRYNSNFEQYAFYMKDIFNICNEISEKIFTEEQYKEYIECVRKRSKFFETIEGELAKKLGIENFKVIHVLCTEGFEKMLLNPNIGVEDFLKKIKDNPDTNEYLKELFDNLNNPIKEFQDINHKSWIAKDINATNVLHKGEKTQENKIKEIFTEEKIKNTNFSYVDGKITETRQIWNNEINEKIKNSTNEKGKKDLERELDVYHQSRTKGAPDVYLDKQGKKEIDEKIENKSVKELFEQDYEGIANEFGISFPENEIKRQK